MPHKATALPLTYNFFSMTPKISHRSQAVHNHNPVPFLICGAGHPSFQGNTFAWPLGEQGTARTRTITCLPATFWPGCLLLTAAEFPGKEPDLGLAVGQRAAYERLEIAIRPSAAPRGPLAPSPASKAAATVRYLRLWRR